MTTKRNTISRILERGVADLRFVKQVCSAYISLPEDIKPAAEKFIFFSGPVSEWNTNMACVTQFSGVETAPDDMFARLVAGAPAAWCVKFLGFSSTSADTFLFGDDSKRDSRARMLAERLCETQGNAKYVSEVLFWGRFPCLTDMLCGYLLDEIERAKTSAPSLPESLELSSAAFAATSRNARYPKLAEAVCAAEEFRTPDICLHARSPFAELLAGYGRLRYFMPSEDEKKIFTETILRTADRLGEERPDARARYLATSCARASNGVCDLRAIFERYLECDPGMKRFIEALGDTRNDSGQRDRAVENVEFLLPENGARVEEGIRVKVHTAVKPAYAWDKTLELLALGNRSAACEAACAISPSVKRKLFSEFDIEAAGTETAFTVFRTLFPKGPPARRVDNETETAFAENVSRMVVEMLDRDAVTPEEASVIVSPLRGEAADMAREAAARAAASRDGRAREERFEPSL